MSSDLISSSINCFTGDLGWSYRRVVSSLVPSHMAGWWTRTRFSDHAGRNCIENRFIFLSRGCLGDVASMAWTKAWIRSTSNGRAMNSELFAFPTVTQPPQHHDA
jgi:hypothetical protein